MSISDINKGASGVNPSLSTLPGTVPVTGGGTGATTAAAARVSLAIPSGDGFSTTDLNAGLVALPTPTATAGTIPYGIAMFTNGGTQYCSVVNNGDNTFSTFSWSSTTNSWTQVGSAVATGTTPRNITAFTVSGTQYVSISNSTSGTITTYSWNATTLVFTQVDSVATGTTPRGITSFTISGTQYVSVCNNGAATFSTYSWNGSAFVIVGSAVATGTSPIDITAYTISGTAYISITNNNTGANSFSTYSWNGSAFASIGAAVATGASPRGIVAYTIGASTYISVVNQNDSTVSTYLWGGSAFASVGNAVYAAQLAANVIAVTFGTDSYLLVTGAATTAATSRTAVFKWMSDYTNYALVGSMLSGAGSLHLASFTVGSDQFVTITDSSSTTITTFKIGNVISLTTQVSPGYMSVTSAAGTTTLTKDSPETVEITGSTTQTVKMAVVATLYPGKKQTIVSSSTGLVTVQTSGSNAIIILSQGDRVTLEVNNTASTTATAWTILRYTNPSYSSTATAAGTTTLTVASTSTQYFTGSTTQTCKLPVVTTLVPGQPYNIVNLSSGVTTVQSSGSNTLQALAANTQLIVTCIAITGTGTASWDWTYLPVQQGITGTGSLACATSPSFTTPSLGVASATSINFGGTALANYVEGTFTPTVTLVGGAGNTVPVYSTNSGRYTRIGNRVFATVELSGDGGAEGAGTGQVTIALPIAISASAANYNTFCGNYTNGAVLGQVAADFTASASTIPLYNVPLLNTVGAMAGNDQNNTSRKIELNFNYEV